MFQCNRQSDFQYARFPQLAVYLHFGLYLLVGIPTMTLLTLSIGITICYITYVIEFVNYYILVDSDHWKTVF